MQAEVATRYLPRAALATLTLAGSAARAGLAQRHGEGRAECKQRRGGVSM
jgi:hypothetical protein